MPGFRDDLGKRLEGGLAEQTHAKGFTGVFIPEAAIGSRVVNEGNTVRSFSPDSRFCLVFFDELRKRTRPWMRSIRKELANQSAQFLAGSFAQCLPGRLFALRQLFGEAGWFIRHHVHSITV